MTRPLQGGLSVFGGVVGENVRDAQGVGHVVVIPAAAGVQLRGGHLHED